MFGINVAVLFLLSFMCTSFTMERDILRRKFCISELAERVDTCLDVCFEENGYKIGPKIYEKFNSKLRKLHIPSEKQEEIETIYRRQRGYRLEPYCYRKCDCYNKPILSLACSSVGNYLAAACGNVIGLYRNYRLACDLKNCVLVKAVAFEPFGTGLVAGAKDGKISIWDIEKQKTVQEVHGHDSDVNSVCFSNNNVISGSCDGTIRVYDSREGKYIGTYAIGEQKSAVTAIACFALNNNYLVSGSQDKQVSLFDLRRQRCIARLCGHYKPVMAIATSPWRQEFASGSADGYVRLWDLNTLKCKCELQRHTQPVTTIAYSPADNHLTSGSNDCSIKIWDTKKRKCLQTMGGHEEGVLSVVYEPTGESLISGSRDGAVHIWPQDTFEQMVYKYSLYRLNSDRISNLSREQQQQRYSCAYLRLLSRSSGNFTKPMNNFGLCSYMLHSPRGGRKIR